MKKTSLWMAAAIVSSILVIPGAAGAAEMKGMYDYSKVEIMQQNGMDLVPLRAVAESLGFSVKWNEQDRSVMLSKGNMGMENKMGDEKKKMDDGMMEKGMTDKGMEDKGMMEKNMLEKRIEDKGMTDKGMEDKDTTDKSMTAEGSISIKIGSKTMMVDGMEKMVGYPAVIMNDKTYVAKDLIDNYLMMAGQLK
jgi:hypothetical protein